MLLCAGPAPASGPEPVLKLAVIAFARLLPRHLAAGLPACAIACLFAAAPGMAAAADAPAAQARADYRAAHAALRRGDVAGFRRLRAALDNYVLAGYLDYAWLAPRLDGADPDTVRKFIADNADAPVSDQLRRAWLHQLARRGQWELFMAEYHDVDDDDTLRCYHFSQQFRRAADKRALATEFEALWLVGRSQPDACDKAFSAWQQAGLLTPELVWARITLAMDRGQLGLATHLARRYLDRDGQRWVERWQAMYRDPRAGLARINFNMDTPMARAIVRTGVARLGGSDPEFAMARWEALKQSYSFLGEDDNDVRRRLGIQAARQHRAVAVQWLAAVAADPGDTELRQWRARAAVRAGEWQVARQFIASMPEQERASSEWRFFLARALEETGDKEQARALYHELARAAGYHGFLAADRLGEPYAIAHSAVAAAPAEVDELAGRRAVRMAQELFELGEIVPARRQWAWAIRGASPRDLQIAALIAHRWGWHDRAIMTVRRSGYDADLELLFPVLYKEHVQSNATRHHIDPEWIYGVLRQESAFMSDVASSAGALGLMQLMPRTGREMARELKLNVPNRYAMLRVDNNIKLGSGYLDRMLEANDNHMVLATASYNAGPHRVKRWRPETEPLDADVWVETIPFDETRGYVRNVLGFTTIYDYRLGNEHPTRISDRMPPVPPAH